MTETQIAGLARSRVVTREIELLSPITGHVLTRSVSPGQRLEKGTELYRIADLSRVWVIADILTAAMGIFTPEIDPVCGMEVDQAKATQAGRVSVHRGETLYFCSDQCKKLFDATPAQYGPAVPPTRSLTGSSRRKTASTPP